MPRKKPDYRTLVLKTLNYEGECGFNQLRKKAKIAPEALRGLLPELVSQGFIELQKADYNKKERIPRHSIRIAEKGREYLISGDVIGSLKRINDDLASVLKNSDKLKSWRKGARDQGFSDGGWHEKGDKVSENYKKYSQEAIHSRGKFTSGEINKLGQLISEREGFVSDSLLMMLKIYHLMHGIIDPNGKIVNMVVGIGKNGSLVGTQVSLLKGKDILMGCDDFFSS